jgi:hypothetical protein
VGSGKSIIYIDNIYFYKGNPTAIQQIEKESVVVYNKNRQLHIQSGEELMNGQIDIFDVTGRKLMTKTITNRNERMDIGKSGILLVKISNAAKQSIITKKVVVN